MHKTLKINQSAIRTGDIPQGGEQVRKTGSQDPLSLWFSHQAAEGMEPPFASWQSPVKLAVPKPQHRLIFPTTTEGENQNGKSHGWRIIAKSKGGVQAFVWG